MTIKMSQQGLDRLKIHEGYRATMYKCTAGANTIGYGHNCDANPMTKIEKQGMMNQPKVTAEKMLIDDLLGFERSLEREKPIVKYFTQPRQDALINLTFNMGVGWVKGWPNTWKQIEAENWEAVAASIRGSKYARQVGYRAVEIADQLASGVYA